ncbi:MAG: A/G-specific adenine glycosylase [Myxococcales bacterium]|nr:A/G-specific adenine glycosylase [Myxococcales bacterium]
MSRPSDQNHRALAKALVAWYRKHRRDLPWRQTRDPYAIWVSEVMLQQTRVATVIPYWQAWLAAFPSVGALADAPLDDVLARWAGLGYYSRARNLQRGAQLIEAKFGGRMPSSALRLREVPGIGPYTAGAIASIAFGERVPLVDGNVARVFARLFAIKADIKAASTQKVLWAHGASVMQDLPAALPAGELNQAIMELGATVCTPTSPACDTCPVSGHCVALRNGLVGSLPVMPRRKRGDELPRLTSVALFMHHAARVLFARRTPAGLFGGMWELPQGATLAAARAVLRAPIVVGREVASHQQDLSHRRLMISVRSARWAAKGSTPLVLGKTEAYDKLAWLSPAQARAKGIATSTATLLAHLEDRVI